MWKRRRYYRRKLRARYGRRRYFRRAGVVSKFSSPAAMNKLRNLADKIPSTSYADFVRVFIELNRSVKTLVKAWRYKIKNPMSFSNCTTWLNELSNYQNSAKEDVRATNKHNAVKRRILKWASGINGGEKIILQLGDETDIYALTISTLAKCRSKGSMLQVITTAEKIPDFTLAKLAELTSTVAIKLFNTYKDVVPMVVPTQGS